MDWPVVETVLLGRDERTTRRFLLGAVGVSASAFLLVSVVDSAWQAIPWLPTVLFVGSYLVGTIGFGARHAYRNDGLVVTVVGTFLVLFGFTLYLGLNFLLCLGTGSCPTFVDRVVFGVLLAAGAAIPAGIVAFAVGAGGRRLRNRPKQSR